MLVALMGGTEPATDSRHRRSPNLLRQFDDAPGGYCPPSPGFKPEIPSATRSAPPSSPRAGGFGDQAPVDRLRATTLSHARAGVAAHPRRRWTLYSSSSRAVA